MSAQGSDRAIDLIERNFTVTRLHVAPDRLHSFHIDETGRTPADRGVGNPARNGGTEFRATSQVEVVPVQAGGSLAGKDSSPASCTRSGDLSGRVTKIDRRGLPSTVRVR